MNPRFLLSNILQYSGANAVATALRRNSLTVLCYHRVLDVGDPARSSVDPALVTSSHVFERQMDIIARRFCPLSLGDTLRYLHLNLRLPPRAVLITFDDGVADTYKNAFRVMKHRGIPGVVFLSTGFIGTGQRYWTDLVYERVRTRLGSQRASEEVEKLKSMPSSRRQLLLSNFAVEPESGSAVLPNLTWDQVEEMSLHGFDFGSHTRNHLILPCEPDETISQELTASAESIELRLGRRPVSFAYPDGRSDRRTVDLVRQAGHQLAFTCEEGFVTHRCEPLTLPRLLMHDGISTTPAGDFSPAMFLTFLAGTIPRRYRRAG